MFRFIFGRSKRKRKNDEDRSLGARGLRAVRRLFRASYDAASTTSDDQRHWANADDLSADAAASPEVRRVLRNRARYEVANNSYAKGIVLTLANDTIGTGPRLQMLLKRRESNARVERAFSEWARAINLTDKLRTMRMALAQDGEAFAILINNPRLPHPVKLDLQLIEADQVATPDLGLSANNAVDGIVFDEYGNPIEYHILKAHPGGFITPTMQYDRVSASHVIHLFRQDRPGQHRGIPEITPALPLFAQLRRYTLAVLGAAETAADFAGVLYTDSPPNGEAEAVEPLDEIELEKRMLLTLPSGWRMGQVQAQQPTTTYGEFKREILNEIARCLNMPYNIAACNSSSYNYASGRLDHQTYFRSIKTDQDFIARVVLDRILAAWLDEATLIEGLLPQELRQQGAETPHQWFWEGREHVDPLKEANAQRERLRNHTTTLAREYALLGLDWESALEQRAKELELMRRLGLPMDDASSPTQPSVDLEDIEDAAT